MENLLVETIKQFISFTASEEEIIKNLFNKQSLNKGDYFLKEGEICKKIGFIERGIARYYINDDGEEKTYSFAKEGEFISNYESFIPQNASTKNIQMLEDSQLYIISYENLQAFYQKIKHGEHFGRLVIEQVFIRSLADITSMYTDKPDKRYQKFVKENSALQQRISQYHIASFIGVKPQSLSRIRKKI